MKGRKLRARGRSCVQENGKINQDLNGYKELNELLKGGISREVNVME
jgi:hypothetical protein